MNTKTINCNNSKYRSTGSILMGLLLYTLCGCCHYESYTDRININGHSIFYAAEGRGKPVILLHGNGGSHSDLETAQRQLAQAGYMVYAMDSRGQGDNPPITEYHYKDMAEDVLAFIQAKNIRKPAIYGWSDGGIIALELESMHPGTCSIIVASGANVTAENAIDPELFKSIWGNADNPNELPPLVRMICLEPNMTKEDMQKIRIPVLVCAGEHDLILPEHTDLITKSIPNAEKMIIPNEDHGSYIRHNPMMGEILIHFLKKHGY